jgi:hypothetical protein
VAIITVCVYIDWNSVAARIADVPETSEYTSIKQRVDRVQAQGRTDDLAAARDGSVAGSTVAAGIEESLWLCPVEARRGVDSLREGIIEGVSPGNYLLLVDYTGPTTPVIPGERHLLRSALRGVRPGIRR